MKFLLLAAIVLLLVWLARGGRRAAPPKPDAEAAPPPGAGPQEVVACAQCGVHLPRGEALPGRGGVFCGEAHRRDYEIAHDGS